MHCFHFCSRFIKVKRLQIHCFVGDLEVAASIAASKFVKIILAKKSLCFDRLTRDVLRKLSFVYELTNYVRIEKLALFRVNLVHTKH